MRRRASLVVLVLVALPGTADAKGKPAARPAPPAAPAPNASEVVVRRQASLSSAFATVLARAKSLGPKATVTIVVDPSPAIRESAKAIGEAFASLPATPDLPTTWQVVALGGAPRATVAGPAAVAPVLQSLASESRKTGPNTMGMLRRALKQSPGDAGLLLYLAHGHFEDDVDLEGFVEELRVRKRMLCVVGPEAAFESTWGKVVADIGDWKYERGEFSSRVPGMGSRPFGPEDPASPWHGGDTAYPLLPSSLAQGTEWNVEFSPTLLQYREESLSPRSRGAPDPRTDPDGFDGWARLWLVLPDRATEAEAYKAWLAKVGVPPPHAEARAYVDWFDNFRASAPEAPVHERKWDFDAQFVSQDVAVPSGFGPYGLMRAAGASGGCYVLWSWGRPWHVDVLSYDYGRVNATPPDLRARSEILADIPKRSRAKALLDVWSDLAKSEPALIDRTPPVVGGAPASIDGILGDLYLVGLFKDVADRDKNVADGRKVLPTLEAALKRVAEIVEKSPAPKDDVDRRLAADADLFQYGLAHAVFRVKEFLAWAQAVGPDDWKRKKKSAEVYLRDVPWVPAGADDEPALPTEAVPKELASARELLALRRAFLARHRGTPFGSIVARNPIVTYRVDMLEPSSAGGIPPTSGRGSSSGTPPPTTGSSGTPGPTTK